MNGQGSGATTLDPVEEAIFHAATELSDPSVRAAFLERACGGNAALRARIKALLDADVRAQRFLDGDPLGLAQPDEPPVQPARAAPDESPGTVIGRYRLLKPIGEGGMGVVYLAEQQEPVRRRVALKIIKPGMDTRQVIARFEAERQALALMDHPNIAKVLDGGTTGSSDQKSAGRGRETTREPLITDDDSLITDNCSLITGSGRSYFVMELVEGVPITEFCEHQQLGLEERLRLFIPVCQAVQHAHQKGIIHRDLKPSNVMVTIQDGVFVPKVIDFGVAKALNQRLTEKTLFTQHATLIGTPSYMSPEQAEMGGMDVDTRSDIYSLGVLLYELLTGTQPFPEERLRSVAYAEMQRIILHEEPERPSTRLTRELASGSARGSRAVFGGPPKTGCVQTAARTGDAGGRASGEPPEAAREPRALPGRLRTAVQALRGDLDWIVLKCLEKDRNRRYETANGLAADLRRNLADEPVVARPPSAWYQCQKWIRRNTVAFAAALTVTISLIAGVAVSAWQAVRARRAEVEAKSVMDFLLEQLVGTANPFNEAEPDPNKRPTLERIARQLEGRFAGQPLIEAQLRFKLGQSFRDLGEYAQAASQFEKCLAIRREALTLRNSTTLETLAALADAQTQAGRRGEAERLLAEGLDVLRDLPLQSSLGAGMVLQANASLLFRNRQNAEALRYFKDALAVLQRCPNHTFDQELSTIQGIVYATHLVGQTNEAHRLVAEAVQRCERERGETAAATAALLHTQAELLLGDRKWDEALAVLERYVPLNRRLFGTNSYEAVQDDYFLGKAYELKGDVDEAVRRYEPLPARFAPFFPADNPRSQCREIARFFVKQQRYDEARAAYSRLRESYEQKPPEWTWEFNLYLEAVAATQGWAAAANVVRTNLDRHPDSIEVWARKALTARGGHDEDLYQQIVRKIMQLTPTLPQADHTHVPVELAALGPIPFSDAERRQLDGWIAGLVAALPGLDGRVLGWAHAAIGHLQLRLGRLDKCREALDQAQRVLGEDTGSHVFYCRAICLHRLGDGDGARAALQEGDAALRKELPGPLEQIAEFERFLDPWTLGHGVLLRQEVVAELGTVRAAP